MKSDLAIFGGPKTIIECFAPYRSIGDEEVGAAKAVVESGVLSKFLGCWEPDFYGGPRIQQFEREWAATFGARHAVAVNSNTSGLIAALGAVGLEPGDEVIVSPWTMAASATAILMWNAIPVFADIEEETYNLDPVAVEKAVTPLTRALMVPDIFGHGARMDDLMTISKQYGLKVIEDAAQAPGALDHGRHVGTLGDIGVFSLNYHKHIHTGEGGVCVTNDDILAERMQLIRNHAEAVVGGMGVNNLANMLGFNFRMTEIEAAIGSEQLKKLEKLAGGRATAGDRLTRGLQGLRGLTPPVVRDECTHVYYVYAMKVSEHATGVTRNKLFQALKAEGVPGLFEGYANVHLLPLYQKKIAYGTKGFPWTGGVYKGNVRYDKGICPIAERLNDRDVLCIEMCAHQYGDEEIELIIKAFRKVWAGLDELKG